MIESRDYPRTIRSIGDARFAAERLPENYRETGNPDSAAIRTLLDLSAITKRLYCTRETG